MSAFRHWLFRLLTTVRPGAAEREIARELAAHVALLEDEFRRRGLPPERAHRAALDALGGVEQAKELHRDARAFTWLEDVVRDAHYTWRTCRRNPGFAATAILTLALGIGSTTAIFSVIHAVLLNPLPFRDPDRLVRIVEHVPAGASLNGRAQVQGGVPVTEFLELQSRSRPLSHIVAFGTDVVTLVGAAGDGSLAGTSVSAGMFSMLGISPILGRTFVPEEEIPNGPKSIVLGYGAWQRFFGGDPHVLGKVVTFTGSATFIGGSVDRGVGYTVVGVAPAGFHFPDDRSEFWTPLAVTRPTDGRPRRSIVAARLADGLSLEAATEELSGVLHALRGDETKPLDRRSQFTLERLQDDLSGSIRTPLLVLAGAVAFVLLIACANVANLLLARAAVRRQEVAVRLALGAGRARLARQILTETVILGLAGGALGVVLAIGGVRTFRFLAATMPRFDLGSVQAFPRLDAIGLDATVLLFALASSVLTGLLFGIAPMLSHVRTEHIRALRHAVDTQRRFGLRGERAVQGSLVVAEIALAILLLIGSGLLMRSFVKLTAVDPGFDAANVLTFQVAVRGDLYTGNRLKTFADSLVERIASVPAVRSAAYARQLPIVPLQNAVAFRRSPASPSAPPPLGSPDVRFVSARYLQTMGIRLVTGRGLVATASGGSAAEIVINQALARRDFAGEDPIGLVVYIGPESRPFTIVGVAADVRQLGLDREPQPQFFVDLGQWRGPGVGPQFPIGPYFAVRTGDRDVSALLSDFSGIVRQLDPQASLYNVATMEQIVGNSVARPRLYAVLLAVFAVVALALSAVGIFGVMAYTVTQRTQEIGIRIALGARAAQVLRLVLGQSLVLTAVGIALGVAAAAGVTRYLEGMLFGLTPLDPFTFVAACAAFAAIALIASYLPARRATRVDPLLAIRSE